jgi:prevent-host-death family protein
MKSFTFSDMNRQSGEILEAALKGPVKLTKRGKEKLVILPASQFKSMAARQSQAFTVEGAPRSVHDELMKGLESLIGDIDA